MALKDFLDYAANPPQETLAWDIGGRTRVYTGKLVVIALTSTNPAIGTYRNMQLITGGTHHPSLGSADIESEFSRTHTIIDNKIVKVEAKAA